MTKKQMEGPPIVMLGDVDPYALKLLLAERDQLLAEVARLKTVPMKYRRMQFNAELQDENEKLRAEVERLKNVQLARFEALAAFTVELETERDTLSARLAEIEKQEPVGYFNGRFGTADTTGGVWAEIAVRDALPTAGAPLYAHPAPAQQICKNCHGEGVDGDDSDGINSAVTWACQECNGTGKAPAPVNAKLLEACKTGLEYAEEKLIDYDQSYSNHPATKAGRAIITSDIAAIREAISQAEGEKNAL